MKNTTRFIVATATIIVANSVTAASFSGQNLHDWLSSKDGALQLAGQMYVLGIIDSDARLDIGAKDHLAGNSGLSGSRQVCVRPGVKPSELSSLVEQRIAANPALLKQPAGYAIISELSARFPCAAPATASKNSVCTDLSEITYFAASADLSPQDRKQLAKSKASARAPNKMRAAIPETFIERAELTGGGSHGNSGQGLKDVYAARYDGFLTALYQFTRCMNYGPEPQS